MSVTIKLHLNGHCIETAAKEKLKEVQDELINSDISDVRLEEQYQLLLDFIHTADFKKLRASDQRLTGLVSTECELYRDISGKPALTIF